MNDSISDREINLIRLEVLEGVFPSEVLKDLNSKVRQSIDQNRKGIRKFKKFEISFWPPKLSWEWDFPYK